MRKVRWGVISTARIGTEKVIPAMQRGSHCEMVALASRDSKRAKQTADNLKIPKAYGSYEELLADDGIDAVYNPLPNHLHVPWTMRAIAAGKHVLCEKPIALSSRDAQKLLDVADRHPDVKVMEAFMYRHHPQWIKAKEIVSSGQIGHLCTIQSFFSYFNDDPQNIRNQAEIGGGALMDIGCYNISLSRFLYDSEPTRVLGIVDRDPEFQTDRLSSGILQFNEGTSTFTCGTQLTPYQRVHAFGTRGRVEIEIPFNAPPDRPCKAWLQQNGNIQEFSFDICDQYQIQGDLFSKSILDDTEVPTPLSDALHNMRVIEAIFDSAQTNQWVSIPT